MVFIRTVDDLNNITENDIELIFNWFFNEKIDISKFIQTLNFGTCFDQKVIIPDSVEVLYIYENLNKNIVISKYTNIIKLN